MFVSYPLQGQKAAFAPSARKGNSKSQAPKSKEGSNSKLQGGTRLLVAFFDHWKLQFIWSLVLGIWSFRGEAAAFSIETHHGKITIRQRWLDP
jgi:hypothetical protein